MSKLVETERRFLVAAEKVDAVVAVDDDPDEITQGYLGEVAGLRVRVRISVSDSGIEVNSVTFKGKKEAGSGLEIETFVKRSQADGLLPFCGDRLVNKTRYCVPYEGHEFEVDIFHGRHKGLVIAEVELDDINEEVKLPDWIGQEITGRNEFSNYELACTGTLGLRIEEEPEGHGEHGVDCDCQDSCLEYMCDGCGYEVSSNRHETCPTCKTKMRVW